MKHCRKYSGITIRQAIILFFLATVLSSSFQFGAFAKNNSQLQKINIVTTIKPISSLVAAIIGEKIEIQQLIPDFVSPHDYAFKPSDIRKIKSADVIFRIDEDMETLLASAIKLRSESSTLISLADNTNIELLSFSNKVEKPTTPSNQNDDPHGHHHGNIDFHIWTSPKNSIAMANHIAQTLSTIDPKNSQYYATNLNKFTHEINSATTSLKQQLKSVTNTPFVVFHNSWQYFSHYFGLKEPTVINFNHSLSAGIKTIRETRQKITTEKVTCVFSDPSIHKKQINVLTEKLNVNTASIDSMQSGAAPKNNSYVNWLLNTGSTISTCLSRK